MYHPTHWRVGWSCHRGRATGSWHRFVLVPCRAMQSVLDNGAVREQQTAAWMGLPSALVRGRERPRTGAPSTRRRQDAFRSHMHEKHDAFSALLRPCHCQYLPEKGLSVGSDCLGLSGASGVQSADWTMYGLSGAMLVAAFIPTCAR